MARREALIARNPVRVPIQKSLRKASLSGKPYCPHLRCSIRAIIKAAMLVRARIAPSLRIARAGVSDEAVRIWSGRCTQKCNTNQMTRLTAAARPATMARKMRTRPPARMPLGPRKIVLAVAGDEDEEDETPGSGGRTI